MAINTLTYAEVFMQTLDKQMLKDATTGWMETNAGQVIYNGGRDVKIPKMSMSALGDYDRDTGYVQGSVSYEYQTKTITQDRGRTFQIDAMDVNETNFGATAGNVAREFQRLMVIPEIDAYRYSSIASQAIKRGKKTEYTPTKRDIITKLLEDITRIRDICGDVDLVISMPELVSTILNTSEEISKWVDSGNFSHGSFYNTVKMIDGIPILRVPSFRMKTEYVFFDGSTSGQEKGGFDAGENAKDINWIICAKQAPIAISKTDVTRIFDPMTNQKANAWRIDFRKYHDIWILDNAMDSVWVNIKP